MTPKLQIYASIDLILATILQTLRALKEALKEVDRAIEKEFRAFRHTLQSNKGICPVSSAGIFSEIGEIRRFPREEETRMSKSGNEYLRYYLIAAANVLRVHNAAYRAYYETKFKEVTKHQHKRAIVLTARKLVRLVYAFLKKGHIYRVN